MAREISIIHQEILNNISSNPDLQELNSSSKSAIYRLFTYVVSIAIWTLEKLFDIHKKELQTSLNNQKSGRLSWYRNQALVFQYGFNLLPDNDLFDNENATQEQIENSKIVKYAAVAESSTESRVILKIAGENGDLLAPITPPQFEAFKGYLKEFKYAGVDVTVVNYEPDRLYLNLQIIRDPLLIDSNGLSIMNGNKPVEESIKVFMKNLPFNGEFVIEHLEKYLMDNVEGVKIAHIVSAETSWIDENLNDYGLPVSINIRAIPVSGYYVVQNFDNVSYVV